VVNWLKSPFRSRELGPLESELLRILWKRGNATVRELIDDKAVEGAYTTVMTTLDRLYKKGLLEREPEGRAFRYRPACTEDELKRDSLAASLRELLGGRSAQDAPVSFLVDEITRHDAALLDELERAIERKRRELRNTREKGAR
jgi:predicted transcriptional regulator